MTFLSMKMKEAGYQTVHVGKWHLGMSSVGHIPKGRGFDKSLVYVRMRWIRRVGYVGEEKTG
jgi:arylsulfatase A-like enzyme